MNFKDILTNDATKDVPLSDKPKVINLHGSEDDDYYDDMYYGYGSRHPYY